MEADAGFSQVEMLTEYLSSLTLLAYALVNFTTHLCHLKSKGSGIRDEFENFVTELTKRRTSYASLLLSQWIETLRWPTKLHLDVDKTSARLCLQSILSCAADTAKGDVVRVLLALRADMLHLAMECGHWEATKLLLEVGAKVSAKDAGGRTPLHLATQRGYEAVTKLLLEVGAEVSARDAGGRTPLHLAVECGHEAVTMLLLEVGAEVSARDAGGRTPLHLAVECGHDGVTRLLLRVGAEVSARDAGGQTPLHLAANRGDEAAATMLLLESGADVNATDAGGRTPLHLAAEHEHLNTMELLVKHNAKYTGVRTP
jgi:Ankyrin repeats (3 copies)